MIVAHTSSEIRGKS